MKDFARPSVTKQPLAIVWSYTMNTFTVENVLISLQETVTKLDTGILSTKQPLSIVWTELRTLYC